MLTGLPALENTDWSELNHAYGRATDTPVHLRALLREDARSRNLAISHLWGSILHQGTAWTATAPTALVVAGLLSDERIDRGEPIRAHLISFLAGVAGAAERAGRRLEELRRVAAFDIEPFLDGEDDEALYDNEDALKSFYARALLGCISVAPVLMKVMLEGLTDASSRVRTCAAMGAVTLAQTEALSSHAGDIESRLLDLAHEAQDGDERCAHVLALGDLGFSPVAFLKDPSPAVRMCAALAPGLATEPAAVDELLHSMEHHAGGMSDWFLEKPPQFEMHPRFPVVARLIQQLKDFDRLVLPPMRWWLLQTSTVSTMTGVRYLLPRSPMAMASSRPKPNADSSADSSRTRSSGTPLLETPTVGSSRRDCRTIAKSVKDEQRKRKRASQAVPSAEAQNSCRQLSLRRASLERLAGRRLLEGDPVSATLAEVLKADPD